MGDARLLPRLILVHKQRTASRFISLTESRSLSEVERKLLRRAYEHLLG